MYDFIIIRHWSSTALHIESLFECRYSLDSDHGLFNFKSDPMMSAPFQCWASYSLNYSEIKILISSAVFSLFPLFGPCFLRVLMSCLVRKCLVYWENWLIQKTYFCILLPCSAETCYDNLWINSLYSFYLHHFMILWLYTWVGDWVFNWTHTF